MTGVVILAGVACDDNGISDPPSDTTPAAVVAEDAVERPISMNESTSLSVVVLDAEERPVEGATVTFAGSGVEHTLSATTVSTSSDGGASTTLTAGNEAGLIEVAASAGQASSVVFRLTVEADDEATALVKVSGDEQTLGFEEGSEPLVVEVRDQNGDPMEGVTVTFTGSGVEHSLSADSAATDTGGRAEITLTAGNEAGAIDVVAAVDGLDPVSFSLTVEAAIEATALVKVSGDEQTLDVEEESEPLVVAVLDQNGDPMAGVTVAFTGSGVEHSLSTDSATTDTEGLAAITVTTGTEAGEIEIVASVDGLEAVSFTVTVEAEDGEAIASAAFYEVHDCWEIDAELVVTETGGPDRTATLDLTYSVFGICGGEEGLWYYDLTTQGAVSIDPEDVSIDPDQEHASVDTEVPVFDFETAQTQPLHIQATWDRTGGDPVVATLEISGPELPQPPPTTEPLTSFEAEVKRSNP